MPQMFEGVLAMKIMLGTHSSSEEEKLDCDYAVIDLTPGIAGGILAKLELIRELEKKDASITSVEFYAAGYMHCVKACEETESIEADAYELACGIYDGENVAIPESVIQRTECERLVVYANWSLSSGPTILWRCVPKHADIEIETDYIPLELIKKISEGI
jgi:hypothetical protein